MKKPPAKSEHERAELAKLECLHTLFAESAGEDGYLLHSLKTAIEASLTAEARSPDDLEAFLEAANRLKDGDPAASPLRNVFHLDLRETGYQPLFIRTELMRGLKQLSGYDSALLLVQGLRTDFLTDTTRSRKDGATDYESAIAYIDDLAHRWTTPNTRLRILYL